MNYAIALKNSPNLNRPRMGFIKPFFKEQNGEFSVSKPTISLTRILLLFLVGTIN